MPVDKAVFERLRHVPANLPRRAWLCYATRAVERLRPMLDLAWPAMPVHRAEVFDDALAQAARYAAGGKRPSLTVADLRVDSLPDDDVFGCYCIQSVGSNVADLLRCCRRARLGADPPGAHYLYYGQFPWITGKPHNDLVRLHLLSLSHDIDTLLDGARDGKWTDGDPAPPERLGPLWPFGEPQWMAGPWPEEYVCRRFG